MDPLVKFYDEIEVALKNVGMVEALFDGFAANKNIPNFAALAWVQSNTQKTRNFCDYYGSPKILKEICEKPGTLKSKIILPVQNWLSEYKRNLSENVTDLDALARRGIRAMYNLSVVAFFFAKNPQYLHPSGLSQEKMQTEKFLLEVLEVLDNCTNALGRLYDRMNRIVLQDNELRGMRSDIKNMCTLIRKERLQKGL